MGSTARSAIDQPVFCAKRGPYVSIQGRHANASTASTMVTTISTKSLAAKPIGFRLGRNDRNRWKIYIGHFTCSKRNGCDLFGGAGAGTGGAGLGCSVSVW